MIKGTDHESVIARIEALERAVFKKSSKKKKACASKPSKGKYREAKPPRLLR